MAERLIWSVGVFAAHWLLANGIHHFFSFAVKTSIIWAHDIRGGRQGQALYRSSCTRGKKSHHQPPSFCAWTTLQCSPPVDWVCWCHNLERRPPVSMRGKAEEDWEWGDENGGYKRAAETQLRYHLAHWLTSPAQVRFLLMFNAVDKTNIGLFMLFILLCISLQIKMFALKSHKGYFCFKKKISPVYFNYFYLSEKKKHDRFIILDSLFAVFFHFGGNFSRKKGIVSICGLL